MTHAPFSSVGPEATSYQQHQTHHRQLSDIRRFGTIKFHVVYSGGPGRNRTCIPGFGDRGECCKIGLFRDACAVSVLF